MVFKRKKIIFMEIFCTLFFATSCSTVGVSENANQDGMELTEQLAESGESVAIEQPAVILENQEKGVLVKWNEIPDADGYYVYRKEEKGKYQKISTITANSEVEYLDMEAAAGTTYYYTVRAFQGESLSDFETVKIKTGIWQPEVKVVYAEPEMKIVWNLIAGCDGYIVYKKVDGEKYSQLSIIKDQETLSYIDQDILPGKIYTYAVRAFIGKDKSTYMAVPKAAIGEPLVEVKEVTEGMEISWNEIEEAEGYYVYRKKEGEKYEIIQQLSDPKITSYIDKDFSVGQKCFYTVRSYLGDQKSSFSEVDVTTDLGRVAVILQLMPSGVQIEWNQIAEAEGYYIYRKEEGEEEYALVDTVTDASTVSYVDQQIEKGKTYYYFVRAFLGDVESSFSGSTISVKDN